MIGRIQKGYTKAIGSLLKENLSPQKLTLCIVTGITLGIFPVLGTTTLLCLLAAFLLRVNIPAIQVVNYMVYPLQLFLLAPFYTAGSWMFSYEGNLKPGKNLLSMLQNDFWGGIVYLGDLTSYAILTWVVFCPFIMFALYFTVKPVVEAVMSLNAKSGQVESK